MSPSQPRRTPEWGLIRALDCSLLPLGNPCHRLICSAIEAMFFPCVSQATQCQLQGQPFLLFHQKVHSFFKAYLNTFKVSFKQVADEMSRLCQGFGASLHAVLPSHTPYVLPRVIQGLRAVGAVLFPATRGLRLARADSLPQCTETGI